MPYRESRTFLISPFVIIELIDRYQGASIFTNLVCILSMYVYGCQSPLRVILLSGSRDIFCSNSRAEAKFHTYMWNVQ